jgi:hypothetical protein
LITYLENTRFMDLTRQRFGKIEVLEHYPHSGKQTKWVCKCDCGSIKIIEARNLRGGFTTSCGCVRRQVAKKAGENRVSDLVGKVFGRLTVLERVSNTGIHARWKCRCVCGKETEVLAANLKRGNVGSCGCLSKYRLGGIFQPLISKIYKQYRTGAKSRNYDFSLTLDDIVDIIFNNCYYCNGEPSNKCVLSYDTDRYCYYNGIDRIDNTKGYNLDNIVPCCHKCNFAKSHHTQQEFLEWALRLADNIRAKQVIKD